MENTKGIDVLINNAAILNDKMVFNMTPEQWGKVLDCNLNGHFF
ncbi:SDR family NAD(P)-dependent oxidoreductase [Acidiplasma cupricumulans]|nr:SDR family NAD(P)-dependent oxidoreductase [Acidiplasma cupricumulans]